MSQAGQSNFALWQTWLFVYLAVCLTVRMAPMEGQLKGAIGAILLLGVLTAVFSQLLPAGQSAIRSGWPILSFSVATLLVLLLVSLVVRGVISLVRMFTSPA